jgi:hypothetical protein
MPITINPALARDSWLDEYRRRQEIVLEAARARLVRSAAGLYLLHGQGGAAYIEAELREAEARLNGGQS